MLGRLVMLVLWKVGDSKPENLLVNPEFMPGASVLDIESGTVKHYPGNWGDNFPGRPNPVVSQEHSDEQRSTGVTPSSVSWVQTAQAGGVAVSKGRLGFRERRKKGKRS